jgi:hypothetical protein
MVFSRRCTIALLAVVAPVFCAATAAPVPLPAQVATAAVADSADRVAGWRSDIAWWLERLREQHYVYRSKPLPRALVDAAAVLSRNVARYSDERMLFEMQRLAAFVGDGHTYILPLGARRVPGTVLPVRFYLFSDGLYVVDAQPGWESWIGSRLERVGTVPAERVLSRLKPAISADNEHAWKWILPPFVNIRGALEIATDGVRGDSVLLTLRGREGRVRRVAMPTLPPPRMQGVPKLGPSKLPGVATPPLWLRDVQRTYWFEALSEQTLYVQFNQVRNAPDESLAQFAARLDSALITRRPKAVVLDVRHNNGGNSYLYPPLIEALERFEAASPDNRLYVLIGRNTFSAAQNFIAQLDRRTKAVFVGEPSSSKPNFVGEENGVILPWSGAMGSISNRYHENMPGDTRPWIPVAIAVELSSAQYFAGEDPVLQAALAAISRR